jgi:hypothetical protein
MTPPANKASAIALRRLLPPSLVFIAAHALFLGAVLTFAGLN